MTAVAKAKASAMMVTIRGRFALLAPSVDHVVDVAVHLRSLDPHANNLVHGGAVVLEDLGHRQDVVLRRVDFIRLAARGCLRR